MRHLDLSPISSTSGKWLGFVAAVWIQAISGNNYTFSNYSHALKSLMHLNQTQLNALSVAKDIGKAFGLLAGLASDRFVPSTILFIGSLQGLLGYGVQWLVVSQRIKPLPFWQMCIFLCVGGNSSTWMNTCMRNFRKNRGPVSGILKGFTCLSTALFTDLCSALFADDPASFHLMLCIIPFAVCLAGIFFLLDVSLASTAAEDEEESNYLGVFNAVALVTAVYLLAFDFVPNRSTLLSRAFIVGLLVLLALPVGIPVQSFFKHSMSKRVKVDPDIEEQVKEQLLRGDDMEEGEVAEDTEAVVKKRRRVVGEEHTITEAMMTVEFWIMFLSFLCGGGTGLAVINNMGQLG